jgi:hypothetical protein
LAIAFKAMFTLSSELIMKILLIRMKKIIDTFILERPFIAIFTPSHTAG